MFIMIDSVDKVKRFVDITTKLEGNVLLKSGRYLIDGKSIMGIFSLDLIYPVEMILEEFSDEEYDNAVEQLKEFIL